MKSRCRRCQARRQPCRKRIAGSPPRPPSPPSIPARVPQRLGPHIMTGPIAVRGAKAGQVLEVRIKSIALHYAWGYNVIRPLPGALPDDFAATPLIHIPLDHAKMTGRLPWGLEPA